MLQLIANASVIVAALAVLAILVELRNAHRLRSAPDLVGRVEADDGALRAPLAQVTCVVFVLTLVRRRLDQRRGNALQFFEQRPFSVRVGERAWRIDQKQHTVAFVGLENVERPLPFLPQPVLGLLVTRFGHLGHLWAEDHVVVASEAVIADGARVHLFVVDGRVLSVSTKPLQALARSALLRAARASVVAALAALAALLLQ